MAEKMRVHILAKELNVSSKTIIEKCRAEGITSVKNHMSTLSAGLHATIREWFSEGEHGTALETTQRVDLEKVRIRRARKKKAAGESAPQEGVEVFDGAVSATAIAERPPAVVEQPLAEGEQLATADRLPPEVEWRPSGLEPAPVETAAVAEVALAPPPEIEPTVTKRDKPPVGAAIAATVEAGAEPTEELPGESGPPAAQAVAEAPIVAMEAPAPSEAAEITTPESAPAKPIGPAGPQNVPAAAKLRGPRVVRYEAPDYDLRPVRRGPPSAPDFPPVGPRVGEEPKDAAKAAARKKGRLGSRRSTGRAVETGQQLAEWRDRDLAERRERLAGATGRRLHRRRATQGVGGTAKLAPIGPKTHATVHEPIRMKEFCSETGLNFIQLFKVLRDEHEIVGNVNMTLPIETAQLLALGFGIELEVIPARTPLDELREEYANRKRRHLTPRPPVVTLLGHVDHGKTSLMDVIRKTRVAASEDGGITQHIGSYHLETSHGPVTFLDTPGHAAFTAMRARGAQLTDVVVLVVAADDGVMPQTVEAIQHAKAAGVPIVVALNKIDLGDQNKMKIYGQLAEHGLTPSGDWGGDVDVIPTSAVTGEGVKELVEHLADLASLLELKVDATLPARGTVIEAETKPGVGSVVNVLVQEGKLQVGDLVVCGNAFGKVRALLDDRGRKLITAGPGIPAEVWGLDDVPAAGDSFYAVESLQRAKEIATQAKRFRIEESRLQSRKVKTLEEMFQQRTTDEVPELNIIIKAEVDGSLAALRTSLSEIPSDEVRLTIRHAAVGAVNDSDILLAATSDAIIVAFRVETSGGAKRLAEQHGVDVRFYRVIYDACDDIRKALSGLLAPEERIEARATAEVRQVFHIGKVGVVAGSFVSHGTVDRSHLAKVVRDGVIIREGCKFASLRHLKDDVREVRAGMECGIRLEGFDDVHVGDRIETYEIVKIARSL